MHPFLALLAIAGLIAVVTAIGLVWRARTGRLRVAADAVSRVPQAATAGGGAAGSGATDLGGAGSGGAGSSAAGSSAAGSSGAGSSAAGDSTTSSGATGDGALTPADLGGSAPFGTTATLVQFSTEFCARCPATRRLLGEVASERGGVVHLDVDLTHRADLARRFKILQTPTTLVLGPDGVPTARINGLPRRPEVTTHLDGLLDGSHQRHRVPEGNSHVNVTH